MKRRHLLALLGAGWIPGLASAQVSLFDGGQKHALELYRAAASGSEAALEDLRARANDGDRWAAMQFGYLHHTGRAPKAGKNIAIAMKAYRKACKLAPDSTAITGNALAAHNMGIIHLYGDGDVATDAGEAARWFTAAAGDEQHVLTSAAMNLANLYENGYGSIERDPVQAGRWYRAAAGQKEPYALYKLGSMLLNGTGMPANRFEAKLKLNMAAELWSCDAMYLLSQISSSTSLLADGNPVESAKWLLIAAEGDNRYKQPALAAMAKLQNAQRESAKAGAASWVKVHTKMRTAVDYRVPLNESREI